MYKHRFRPTPRRRNSMAKLVGLLGGGARGDLTLSCGGTLGRIRADNCTPGPRALGDRRDARCAHDFDS